ncbi:hypothetical protein GCM10022393_29960 [Aquimarina addita]|uniref:DUF2141 domain-containing protein n=1 Tax=Aquimarina addita TaxID=870485 RepID=A0ABP6UNM5_9FLAO
MKTLLLFFALTLINLTTNAQKSDKATITVTVPNVSGSDGHVLFSLYDETTFMTPSPIQRRKSEITNGIAKITFTNVPAGVYGITCIHDRNDNKRMDFDVNGMPTESYGVSNNNMSYGPPVWSDAKFEISTEELAIEIRL